MLTDAREEKKLLKKCFTWVKCEEKTMAGYFVAGIMKC